MAEIGTFTRTETGYAGELHSFGLHEKLFIVPAKPSDVKNAPDYRLRLDSEDGPCGRRDDRPRTLQEHRDAERHGGVDRARARVDRMRQFLPPAG